MKKISKKINFEITQDEALLFLEYFSDEKMDALLPLLDNNQNLLMIVARMVCNIEKNLIVLFDSDYIEAMEKAKQNLITEFGEFNNE